MSMVEQVARAIFDLQKGMDIPWDEIATYEDPLSREVRSGWLAMARVAIAAMKDAHPLLRAAADLNHVDLDEGEAKQILEDMIAEALK